VIANAVVGGLVMHQTGDGTPVVAAQLPTISIAPPPTAVPAARSPQRVERRAAKARPPVLLGPRRLPTAMFAYCEASGTGSTGASAAPDSWQCDRASISRMIDMDAACQWLYDADAWAGMLDDDDPQTWRCYRDAS
jgi:hypothetical protein